MRYCARCNRALQEHDLPVLPELAGYSQKAHFERHPELYRACVINKSECFTPQRAETWWCTGCGRDVTMTWTHWLKSPHGQGLCKPFKMPKYVRDYLVKGCCEGVIDEAQKALYV